MNSSPNKQSNDSGANSSRATDFAQGFLSLEQVSATYDGSSTVVSDVSLSLNEGELGCLLGPSGCGKTTILRAISGFQELTHGSISLAGTQISSSKSMLPPEQRNVGMVFQDHALFPHISIADNVGFGLGNLTKDDRQKRVSTLLDLVGMSEHGTKHPHELSGGQSQRVALARAIAPRPRLLLMDEPFSNLDTELRESLGYEVRSLLKELGITAIMVTHDQNDAFALGDKIGVISQGKLLQWDSSFRLYHAPNSRFVANFIGNGVFLTGKILDNNKVQTQFAELHGEVIKVSSSDMNEGVDVLLRPDDVKVDNSSQIKGSITRKAFKGAQTLYTVEVSSGESLMSLVSSHDDYDIGDTVGLSINADHLVCFTKRT